MGSLFDNDEYEKAALRAAINAHRDCVKHGLTFEDVALAIAKAIGPYFQNEERERVCHEVDALFSQLMADPELEGQKPSTAFAALFDQHIATTILEGEYRE